MRRSGVSMGKTMGLAAAATVLMLATGSRTAWADGVTGCEGPDCIYQLSYFSNAHTTGAPDATLRLVNDGFLSDHSPDGDLCASIYVFDNNEELNECCGCYITPNGLLTLSVNTNLTHNTLTGKAPTRGVIKVISSREVLPSGCDPTFVNTGVGIHGWLTHIQKAGTTFPQTEEELTNASLLVVSEVGSVEANDLAEDCKVAVELGSGHGVCDCTDAGR